MKFNKLVLVILPLCLVAIMVFSGVVYSYRIKNSEANIILYYLSLPIQHQYILSERAVEDSRARKFFEMIRARGGVEKEVELLTYTPLFTVSRYSPGDGVYPPSSSKPSYRIRLNKKIITELSDEDLAGVIAHEFGHIMQGHLDERWFLSLKDMQDEADEWAVEVVGQDAVIAYIKVLDRKNRKILPKTSIQKREKPFLMVPPPLGWPKSAFESDF